MIDWYVWEFRNNALWDTHQHALLALAPWKLYQTGCRTNQFLDKLIMKMVLEPTPGAEIDKYGKVYHHMMFLLLGRKAYIIIFNRCQEDLVF